MKKDRVILHYDMDSYYASIEIRDNPRLLNKPLVVGGSIVTTASYEARKFGIHSAMKVSDAKKLCPSLLVIPPNKEKYSEISRKIHNLVLRLTHKIEFIALDEGYIDVSDIIDLYPSKEFFAKKFRERIKYHTGLTCSIGIGFNKLSAKLASNINKPSGQYIFTSPLDFTKYISDKNIGIIPGVGKKLSALLAKDSILKVKDIYPYSLAFLCSSYGKSRGELLYSASRGIDYREVEYKKPTHSIGNENTFKYPLNTELEIRREFDDLFEHSYRRLLKDEFISKTVILKIRFSSNETITRSKTLEIPTDSHEKLKKVSDDLLENVDLKDSIRLLGVSFGNLTKKSVRQLAFF